MFIAKDETFRYVLRGSQINPQSVVQSPLTCPICGEEVEFDPSPEHHLDYFRHASPDCFDSDGASDEHRFCVEIAVGAIWNRLSEVFGDSIEIDIDVERRVGTPSNFVITDVRVTRPIQISAEIFYQAERLGLKRRISTLSANDYRTFLIFHRGGIHNIHLIDRYMRRISSLSVGRFNPGTREMNLGDLFSRDRIDFNSGDDVPNYMVHTR
jgi:hypothetical protein